MTRVLRWLLTLLPLAFALACSVCALLWLRSYRSYDRAVVKLSGSYNNSRRLKWVELESCNGDLRLSLYRTVEPVIDAASPPDSWPPWRPYRRQLWPRGVKLVQTREMTAAERQGFEDRIQRGYARLPLAYRSSRERIDLPAGFTLSNGQRPPFRWQFDATYSMHNAGDDFSVDDLTKDHDLPGAYAVTRLIIPHGYAVSAVSIVPLLWTIAWSRRRITAWSRCRRGLCTACGYDMRGSAGTCPECGSGRPAGRPQ